jgi:hypothetical protein
VCNDDNININQESEAAKNQIEATVPDGPKPKTCHTPPTNGVSTSNEAAAAIMPYAERQRDRLLQYIIEQGMTGSTAQEAEIPLGMPAQTITPRLLEIRKDGLVKDSGVKRMTRSKRRARVWIDANLVLSNTNE